MKKDNANPKPPERLELTAAVQIDLAAQAAVEAAGILIHDRDPLFTQRFRQTLEAAGVRALRLPKRSPNLNPVAESFVRNIKRECLDRMILFGERHLRYVIEQYMAHYLLERPHRGLDNRRITEPKTPPIADGPVLCHERLGGLLKSYYRQAA